MNPLVPRTAYINFLQRHREQPIIKVVSGVRRCGKSTLFALYRKQLQKEGVPAENILSINLEDLAYDSLRDYHVLYQYITEHLSPHGMNYVFLDEIQQVPQFERAVDSLFIKENVDLYLTGSNGYFMSGELATLLAGRYVELKMLPLSFKEFCSGLPESQQQHSNGQKYTLYLENGSFPYLLHLLGRPEAVQEYLSGIYNTILLKDTLTRLRVGEPKILESIMKYVTANIGSLISPTKIANTLTSSGRKTNYKTVERYLQGLQDSLLLYQAERYDVRGKKLLQTNVKYYLVDPVFRRFLVSDTGRDTGHILENEVYLELVRRGGKVYVGQIGVGEVDFVVEKNGTKEYYQVAESTLSPAVLERELAPLQKIDDQYPKFLLTLDEITPQANYGGIKKYNALAWMLGEV